MTATFKVYNSNYAGTCFNINQKYMPLLNEFAFYVFDFLTFFSSKQLLTKVHWLQLNHRAPSIHFALITNQSITGLERR